MSVIKFYIFAHSHFTLAIFLVAMHHFLICSYICYLKIPVFRINKAENQNCILHVNASNLAEVFPPLLGRKQLK